MTFFIVGQKNWQVFFENFYTENTLALIKDK